VKLLDCVSQHLDLRRGTGSREPMTNRKQLRSARGSTGSTALWMRGWTLAAKGRGADGSVPPRESKAVSSHSTVHFVRRSERLLGRRFAVRGSEHSIRSSLSTTFRRRNAELGCRLYVRGWKPSIRSSFLRSDAGTPNSVVVSAF